MSVWKYRGQDCELVGILGDSETNEVQYVLVNPTGIPQVIRVERTKRGFLPGLTIASGKGDGRKPAHVDLFQQAPPQVARRTPLTGSDAGNG